MIFEPTNADILEALQAFSRDVDEQFHEVRNEIGGMKSEIGSIKAQMVTKDYLDRKLAEQFSDVVNFVKARVSCWKELGSV